MGRTFLSAPGRQERLPRREYVGAPKSLEGGVDRTTALAKVFKALGSETRVRIVQLLRGRALCVGALSARLGVTQGAVSQHLRILRDAGLVAADKRGQFVHYRLDDKAIAKSRGELNGLLGQPDRKGAAPCVRRRRAARSRKS